MNKRMVGSFFSAVNLRGGAPRQLKRISVVGPRNAQVEIMREIQFGEKASPVEIDLHDSKVSAVGVLQPLEVESIFPLRAGQHTKFLNMDPLSLAGIVK